MCLILVCLPHDISTSIFSYAVDWFNANMRKNAEKDVHVELLAWCKPPLGVFKLNLDGSRSCTGLIGAGGVIRD